MEKKTINEFQDLVTKNTYQLSDKTRKSYRVYANRYTISLSLGVLLYSFLFPWQYSVLIAIALAATLEFRYRKKFLPSLKIIADVKKTSTISHQSLIMNAVLYCLFGILLIAYVITESLSPLWSGLAYTLAVFAIGLGIRYALEIYVAKRK